MMLQEWNVKKKKKFIKLLARETLFHQNVS
jgi:hypothetical protein